VARLLASKLSFRVAGEIARYRYVRDNEWLRSRKLLEERPDRLSAVDVVVLRPEESIGKAREAGVGAAGHAVAAIIDAVEHDVAPRRAARVDPRHGGAVGGVGVGKIGRSSVCIAAIVLAPESERLFRRPEAVHRKAAGA